MLSTFALAILKFRILDGTWHWWPFRHYVKIRAVGKHQTMAKINTLLSRVGSPPCPWTWPLLGGPSTGNNRIMACHARNVCIAVFVTKENYRVQVDYHGGNARNCDAFSWRNQSCWRRNCAGIELFVDCLLVEKSQMALPSENLKATERTH